MQNSNVIGIDLAKHIIQVCKIDKHGELISNKAISPSPYTDIRGTDIYTPLTTNFNSKPR